MVSRFEVAYIHIGLHKTGTSTIQKFLFDHRSSLAECGYLYPSINKNHGGDLYSLFSSSPEEFVTNVRLGAVSKTEIEQRNIDIRQRYDKEFSSIGYNNIIISGESLSLLDEKGHLSMLDYFKSFADEVCIVLWVRSPIAWSNSRAQQYIKQGNHTLEGLNKSPPILKYRSLISLLCKVYGKMSVKISSLEAAKTHPKGVLGRFLGDINIKTFKSHLSVERINESVSYEAALLLSTLNRVMPAVEDGRYNLKRSARDFTPFMGIEGERFSLSKEALEIVTNDVRDDLEWLADSYSIDYRLDVGDSTDGRIDQKFSRKSIEIIAKLVHAQYLESRKAVAYRRAEIFYFNSNYDKSLRIMLKSVSLGDVDEHGYRLLCQIYRAKGEVQLAYNSIISALSLNSLNRAFLGIKKEIEIELRRG